MTHVVVVVVVVENELSSLHVFGQQKFCLCISKDEIEKKYKRINNNCFYLCAQHHKQKINTTRNNGLALGGADASATNVQHRFVGKRK